MLVPALKTVSLCRRSFLPSESYLLTCDSCAGAEANEEICHQVGKPCEVVRRAAKAAAEAIAEANPRHQCFTDGAMCFKAKRALDDLSGVVNSML